MNKELITKNISLKDLKTIKEAKTNMENIGSLMKVLNKVGGKIETGIDMIPTKMQGKLKKNLHNLLMGIVKTNILSMQKNNTYKKPSEKTYKALVTSTGILSGVFGSTTGVGTAIFLSELAMSTKFMMRAIIDIARSHGENIQQLDTQLACIQVFALGGTSKADDGAETSYYSTRVGLNSFVKSTTNYAAKNGLQNFSKVLLTSTNPLSKLIGSVVSKFINQVSEKFIAQAIPIAGAVGGGAINYVFITHFQKIAEAHFSIRELERIYGEDLVREAYESIELATQ